MHIEYALVLLCLGGGQTRGVPPANSIAITFKTPANLTFEELVYIHRFKGGDETNPPKTLSPCARAILGCCKGATMNSECSEDLKCGAFFFDDNPCEDKFIIDALNAAKVFYNQFEGFSTPS